MRWLFLDLAHSSAVQYPSALNGGPRIVESMVGLGVVLVPHVDKSVAN
jgi:hypothetical protein